MSSELDPDRPRPPLRTTSGAGFDFEDRVGAWMLMKILVGEPVSAIGGRGSMLQAQVAALDWKIDDLLVTSLQNDGTVRKLALSCKGNVQVSGTALPESFVSAAWAQWHHPKNPISRSNDHLALVTAARHAEFEATWREVKHACEGADASLGLARIRDNAKQSQLFDSVQSKAPGARASDDETRNLIQRLHVLPIELHAADAMRENEAIGNCRQLLASGHLSEAEALWGQLLAMVKKARLEYGTIPVLDAWEQLRLAFSLRDHPDYRSDWEILSRYSADQSSRVSTALPNGHHLKRADEATKVADGLRSEAVSIVIGESGSGKSALVKTVLDTQWPTAAQLWLGPEAATIVVSAVKRGAVGLRHELRELLRATTARENVLVLDATEHLDGAAISALVKSLPSTATGVFPNRFATWRVVVTTQPRGLPLLTTAFSTHATHLVEVGPLLASEVKEAVAATPSLQWLATHESTISALTSLKALAWVLGAGAGLATSTAPFASHIDVVEALWRYWTQHDLAAQALLMRLGMREAGSERTFPISTLDAGQLQVLQQSQSTLPLRLDLSTNHLRFEHDLAGDWARFQYLKELSNDFNAWTAVATNPLWTNALRLLGQHLLRRRAGSRTAWDEAFGVDSSHSGLLQGILFDAICLDPEAHRLLSERADWLLDDHGRRFNQLLTRFLHIATVPTQAIQPSSGWLELYAETNRRFIIVGHWVPMLQFVLAQHDKLGTMLSSPLARFTLIWLTQTPPFVGEKQPTPFRQELTDLALTTARTIQLRKGVGDMLIDLESDFYAAALAGTSDRPEAVYALALELSGRKLIDEEIISRIKDIRAQRRAQHEQRLAANPDLRARHQTAQKIGMTGVFGRQKLPPWPIGASHPVDRDFRKACFKNGVLEPLIRVAPDVAAEVLLALIVEDKPEREFDVRRYPNRERLGLAYPVDPFPTIFWKSPFWLFFQIAPDQAIATLLQLTAFCTDRWAEGSQDSSLALPIAGTDQAFIGNAHVLAWSQTVSARTGNLHCALDSLERWLVTRINEGVDVSSWVRQLMSKSHSMAILGVLINVGKHHPPLFTGPLSPLLAKPELYAWDSYRVENIGLNFVGNFTSLGDQLFKLAQQWVFAPHRRVALIDIATEQILIDPNLADVVRGWTKKWNTPDNLKHSLEQRVTAARLDNANYRTNGHGKLVFVLPAELAQEVQAWEKTYAPAKMQLTIPNRCQQLLDAAQPISDEHATALYELLTVSPHEEHWVQQRFERAIAATITALAPEVLTRKGTYQNRITSILEAALASLPSTGEDFIKSRFPITHAGMDFVALALTRRWALEAPPESDEQVVRLLTSGDRLTFQSTMAIAYPHRDALGDRWWRLLRVGVLWSGLSILMPRHGEVDSVERVWTHWLRRLRTMSLRLPDTPEALDLARVDAACSRLLYRRQLRAHLADSSRRHPNYLARTSLDTQWLDDLFHWLLRGPGTGNHAMDLKLVSRFWAMEVEHARDGADDDGEMQLSGQFAYHVVERLAVLALNESAVGAQRVWEQVLELGPAGHNAIQHFVRSLFLGLSKGADPQRFEALWRALADYALAADWNVPRLWFYGDQMKRAIFGFGNESALSKLQTGAAIRMQEAIATWASTHLKREDNLAGLCLFLASPFGAPLRFEGLLWIKAALEAPDSSIAFHRDNSGDTLVNLIVTILQNDLTSLRKRADARDALLEISAALASAGRPDALAIQDRLRAALMS